MAITLSDKISYNGTKNTSLENNQNIIRYKNNTSTSNQNISPYRIKDGNYTRHTYDTNDQEYMLMQNELNDFMPDSTTMAEQAMYRRLADNQISNRNKVFGRDIFNNPRLNFEPNMNIATPQNYRLGPGDAVYVDIYGASQKTIESTITPDGTIVIEGYGPIELSGLTVNQANSKLKATLGARYKSSCAGRLPSWKFFSTKSDAREERQSSSRPRSSAVRPAVSESAGFICRRTGMTL